MIRLIVLSFGYDHIELSSPYKCGDFTNAVWEFWISIPYSKIIFILKLAKIIHVLINEYQAIYS